MLNDEDSFQIIIDTFNDSRSGYMFVTNPLGAKLEQQIFEEGEGAIVGANSNVNRNWDGVWDVSSRRTDEGWVAELSMPMTTVRFRSGDEQTWGINFMRLIRRKNESVFWAPIPKADGLTGVSLAGSMVGLRSLSHGVDLRIKPFVVAGARGDRVNGSLDGSGIGDVGLDVKYGLTSGINLDLTLNTDFAQVEVDQQQVNLTRFSLFFPEKREFFLENASLFNVGTRVQGPAGCRPVLQSPHRSVGVRTARADHRRGADDRQGRPAQHCGHGSPDRRGVRSAGREVSRDPV